MIQSIPLPIPSTCKSPATRAVATKGKNVTNSSKTPMKIKENNSIHSSASPSINNNNNNNHMMITNGLNDSSSTTSSTMTDGKNSIDQWYKKVTLLVNHHKKIIKQEKKQITVNPRTGRKQWNRPVSNATTVNTGNENTMNMTGKNTIKSSQNESNK